MNIELIDIVSKLSQSTYGGDLNVNYKWTGYIYEIISSQSIINAIYIVLCAYKA